ncbi:hypothetical protein AVEN_237623-1 [Araneus ventricosus]|uniref:Uncharacterized protein n=1 Tax=Araneus ventricosus TaxID=182803 RepID=A0A4Y1ZVN3_ARAVE|nr:hypothetical protein AVEN_237623-1 [Araneus ventricosus]
MNTNESGLKRRINEKRINDALLRLQFWRKDHILRFMSDVKKSFLAKCSDWCNQASRRQGRRIKTKALYCDDVSERRFRIFRRSKFLSIFDTYTGVSTPL